MLLYVAIWAYVITCDWPDNLFTTVTSCYHLLVYELACHYYLLSLTSGFTCYYLLLLNREAAKMKAEESPTDVEEKYEVTEEKPKWVDEYNLLDLFIVRMMYDLSLHSYMLYVAFQYHESYVLCHESYVLCHESYVILYVTC